MDECVWKSMLLARSSWYNCHHNLPFVLQEYILYIEFMDVYSLIQLFGLKWNKFEVSSVLVLLFILFTGRLFIADTNNSLIRYLDLKTNEFELRTLELKGFQPPKPKSRSFKRLRRRPTADTVPITVDAISSEEGNLSIEISLPNEYHFSKVLIIVLSFKRSL